jgi:hypothetical protein
MQPHGMEPFGRALVVLGLMLAGMGLLLLYGKHLSFLGRLPGDIRIERDHFTFYFPLATCVLLSIVLSLLLYLLGRR